MGRRLRRSLIQSTTGGGLAFPGPGEQVLEPPLGLLPARGFVSLAQDSAFHHRYAAVVLGFDRPEDGLAGANHAKSARMRSGSP